MTHVTPPFLALIQRQFEMLSEERANHVRKVLEIDKKLADAARVLGLQPEQAREPEPFLPRLKREDQRSAGTLSAAMLSILLEADRGYTRLELKAELVKNPKFADQLERNLNSFYNNVLRYIRSGKITEVGNLLYHPDRAPLPEGQEDPTGQHLPANVSSLFGDR